MLCVLIWKIAPKKNQHENRAYFHKTKQKQEK